MIYSISKKKFINSALMKQRYVLTDTIRDINNFGGKFFFDETNTYYLAVAYGPSETITIFDCYSKQTLARAKENFTNAVGFCFICDYKDYNENNIDENFGITYHYKFKNDYSLNNAKDIKIKKIDSGSSFILETYDEIYMSFLPKSHGARLANFWNRYESNISKGEHSIYIAYVDDTIVGHVLIDNYDNYNACDITQITIEEKYQQKGYGKQLLNLVVCDIKKD